MFLTFIIVNRTHSESFVILPPRDRYLWANIYEEEIAASLMGLCVIHQSDFYDSMKTKVWNKISEFIWNLLRLDVGLINYEKDPSQDQFFWYLPNIITLMHLMYRCKIETNTMTCWLRTTNQRRSKPILLHMWSCAWTLEVCRCTSAIYVEYLCRYLQYGCSDVWSYLCIAIRYLLLFDTRSTL